MFVSHQARAGLASTICRVCNTRRGIEVICIPCRTHLPWQMVKDIKRGDTLALKLAKVRIEAAS